MHKTTATGALLPEHVRAAAILSFMLASTLGVFSVAACMVGAFSGPHILVPGVIAAVTAALMCVAASGLLSRAQWAKWLLVALSTPGVLVFTSLVLIGCIRREIHPAAALFFVAASFTFCFNIWALFHPSPKTWFADQLKR